MRISLIKNHEHKAHTYQSKQNPSYAMKLQSHIYKHKFLQSSTIYNFNFSLTHVQIQLKSIYALSRLDLRHG